MTQYEAAIVTAHTGYTIGADNLEFFIKYAESKLNRKVFYEELAFADFGQEIKAASYEDFIKLKVE